MPVVEPFLAAALFCREVRTSDDGVTDLLELISGFEANPFAGFETEIALFILVNSGTFSGPAQVVVFRTPPGHARQVFGDVEIELVPGRQEEVPTKVLIPRIPGVHVIDVALRVGDPAATIDHRQAFLTVGQVAPN